MWPEAFVHRMENVLGSGCQPFLDALSAPSPVSIRLNPFKPSSRFSLEEKIPWCSAGRYLASRPLFTADPLFHAGCYYVQEASSMFIEQAVTAYGSHRQIRRVLDLCAAPGGKSTHLRSLIPEEAVLVANEVVNSRNHILCENIGKWGHPGVIITRNTPESLLESSVRFDIVLVDAPCSGEGLFRKDPDAVREWSPAAVEACSLRQRSIMDAALQLLAPGGLLIYSTCTWSKQENEEIVDHLRETHAMSSFELHVPDGVVKTTGYRFYPQAVKGEGFFLAALSASEENRAPDSSRRSKPLPGKVFKPDTGWLNGDFDYRLINETLWAYPSGVSGILEELAADFHIIQAGCRLGELKGGLLTPHQDLAQSVRLDFGTPSIDLPADLALRYLRGDAVPFSGDSRGWQVIRHEGHALGWAKAVTGRLNNSYPKERRIRMAV